MKKIFVFGSNLAGIHGAGSALEARKKYGARQGKGEGLQGSSYAIPTKDRELKSLPLGEIQSHVNKFLAYAAANQYVQFRVVAIGCGLAGFSYREIAPFFQNATGNVVLPPQFDDVLDNSPALM